MEARAGILAKFVEELQRIGQSEAFESEVETIAAAVEVVGGYIRAAARWPDYNSFHEALGVLREEYREFEEEVFKKKQSRKLLRAEAVDIAVVCLRVMTELTTREQVAAEEAKD